jgi:hypothetical protein
LFSSVLFPADDVSLLREKKNINTTWRNTEPVLDLHLEVGPELMQRQLSVCSYFARRLQDKMII